MSFCLVMLFEMVVYKVKFVIGKLGFKIVNIFLCIGINEEVVFWYIIW